ncbi:DUF1549 domain-containing protein [Schlesneria paludicola]|uniref:DUF1549 domain-containing protein n=1 Tax=Schlesneria paludicola TaxID=360056 RepID=UPI00029A65A7|nr:DUF1549 domain-containing protein [Schlesneria paludicola]
MQRRCWLTIVLGAVLIGHSSITRTIFADDEVKVTRIWTVPDKLTLSDIRDARSLLVLGETQEGKIVDFSHVATRTPQGSSIRVDQDGYVVPVMPGPSQVVVTAGGQSVTVPVDVKELPKKEVDFIRDVEPIMAKVGCNQGTCHGAQQGRKGFKLSLRGYDPLYDFRALVDDVSGRRFNRAKPSDSLMLLKPTQGVPHEGGFLFDEDSRAYKIIEQWIAEGCKFSEATRPSRLELLPASPVLERTSQTQQMQVIAYFSDGTSRDVTRDAVFEVSNFEVATVSPGGEIKAVRRGETPVLVRYEGAYASNTAIVLGKREGFEWKDSPEFNFIDKHVNAKLKRLKILPAELCSDADFLRRVSLDLTGLPATGDQTKAFLNDARDSQTKRAAKIEELLESPDYVDHWTLKWSDLLLSNRKFIKEQGVWAFRNWIRRAVAINQPYDQFVYELMTASGSTLENPSANYYRIAREPREVMENMTQVFVGTRFVCAQCHDHPFEKWTQTQYYQLSAFFGGVGRKGGNRNEEEVIYDMRAPATVTHAGTGQAVSAAFPFQLASVDLSSEIPRVKLASWLTSRENPYFAKSIVNRYWSYLNGRGIIDPVDDIRLSNPPTNPELLDALTSDFIAHNFDLKHVLRTIANSHTYQRTFATQKWNEDDDVNYSHATPRRLAAEQLFDAIMTATGAPTNLPGVPGGFHASQLPDSSASVSFLDMFGRAPRESPCECERSSEVSLAQTLTLINGPTISEAIVHPQGLIAKLVAAKAEPVQVVNEIYLSVFNRPATEAEREQGVKYLATNGTAEGAQDLMWALINSPAFLFNR